jgi:tRNA pseudouridine13 synthase
MIIAGIQDRALGMDYYISDSPGCGGMIKSNAEDFSVTEVFEDLRYEGGRYLVLDIEKTNWDTHHLIREMARRLGISQKRFGWAGTKDKRAVTSQRISIMNLDESELSRVNLPDLKIKVLGRTNRAVGLGDLLGNRFAITIRDLSCPQPEAAMSQITREIAEYQGVANYFGVQRFGDRRPVTHLVGEALVRGQIEEAVYIYLAKPFADELAETRDAREKLWVNRDIPAALKRYPQYLHYELAMLNYLVEHPHDYAHAFDVLSINLRRLFVHAYQSYLFNKILSHRLARGISLSKALPGDVVCFGKNGLPDVGKTQRVTPENEAAINRLAERKRAFLTLPLIGFETELADGVGGEIERKILADEAVTPESFRVEANPDLGSRGTRRAAICPVSPEVNVLGNRAELRFVLLKGSYATVVLREYMKGHDAIEIQSKDSAEE